MAAATTNLKLGDVLEAFAAIQTRDPGDRVIVGNPGTERIRSHVQGVVAYGEGYLLTHSNVDGRAGSLLVDDGGDVARTFPLEQGSIDGLHLSHPGGCQRIGDYLAIAFESIPTNRNVSRVVFFDVSNPAGPVPLTTPAPIERRGLKAGCVGCANLTLDTPTGAAEHWFVAVFDNGRVDLYRSDGRAFPDTAFTHQFADTIADGYEGFCLVAEESNRLFAVAFRRDSDRRDLAELYAVHLDTHKLELLVSREFHTRALRNVHFRWGTGIDVRSCEELAILATGRNCLLLPFAEDESDEEGEARRAERPADRTLTERGSLHRHCHINTFTRERS